MFQKKEREKEIKKENRYTNSQIAVFKHFGVEDIKSLLRAFQI